MQEIADIGSSKQLTDFFVTLLLNCFLENPLQLFETFKKDMMSDKIYKMKGKPNPKITPESIH